MICFQILYLWHRQTTARYACLSSYPLWFAFRFCIFDIDKQLYPYDETIPDGCDLLSDFVSLTSTNNSVITYCCPARLWFAFRFCIFDIDKQRSWLPKCQRSCCDLLSDFVSLTSTNNSSEDATHSFTVVICFQILYLWHRQTTFIKISIMLFALWFAFRFCIFDIDKQPVICLSDGDVGCDLLSDFVSLTSTNNTYGVWRHRRVVVICFQILYLWHRQTTGRGSQALHRTLWFAFRFCIFDIDKQHTGLRLVPILCCDLLSDFVSLTSTNN